MCSISPVSYCGLCGWRCCLQFFEHTYEAPEHGLRISVCRVLSSSGIISLDFTS
jgi:hypothetical protein